MAFYLHAWPTETGPQCNNGLPLATPALPDVDGGEKLIVIP